MSGKSVEHANILGDEWIRQSDFCKANGLCERTVVRYRNEPDGMPYCFFAGRVFIHLPKAREWLARRLVQPNPTRTGRR